MLSFLLLLSETYAISVFYMMKNYINGIINQLVISGITAISFCNCYAVNHLSHTVKVGWLEFSVPFQAFSTNTAISETITYSETLIETRNVGQCPT